MKEIKLTQGKVAIVDDEDYPYLNRFNWQLSGDNKFACRDVTHSRGKKVKIYMQSLLVQNPNGHFIRHINKNGLDNRKENLEPVHMRSILQSRVCKRDYKTSRYIGVMLDKQKKKWRATITCGGKQIHCGFFIDENDAAKAYNEKARKLYGKFAYQNIIE